MAETTKAVRRRPRTKARVEDTEPKRSVTKSAAHRTGNMDVVPEGMIEIMGQASELVPVAQFANVTIGPVYARRLILDPGLSKLVGTKPDDWNDEQNEIADKFKGEIAVMNTLIQEVISDDREIVEESVRLHNQKMAEQEAAQAKKAR